MAITLRTSNNFRYRLAGLIELLGPVGEDGGLLIHPDGSAHILDENQDEGLFFPDVMNDIEGACVDAEVWFEGIEE